MDKRIIKASLGITIIILVEKLLGFFREIIQAFFFGTGSAIDCIVSANLMISVFFGWLATISIAFTPVYKRKNLLNEGKRYTDSIISACIILSALSLLLCQILKQQLIRLALPGFDATRQQVAIDCVSILCWSILFMGVIQLNNAYLAANGKYVFSVISNLCINIVQILALILSRGASVMIVAWGVVVAYVVQWLVTLLFLRKTGYVFRPTVNDRSGLRETIAILIPISLTHIIDDICTFFDKLFASFLSDGAISSLAYANSLRKVIFSFVTILVTTIVYPRVSDYLAKKQLSKAQEEIAKCIQGILLLLTPIIVCSILCSTALVSIIFQHGAFNADSTIMTARSFFAYLIGLIPLSINAVLTKYFYAKKQANYCTILGIINVVLNIILDYFLVKTLGHMGLALGTSLSVSITMPFYIFLFSRQKGFRIMFNRNMLKICICLILSIVSSVFIYKLMFNHINNLLSWVSFLSCGLLFVFSMFIVIGLALVLKEDNTIAIWHAIFNRLV